MPFPISHDEIAKTEIKTGFKFPVGLKTRFSKDNGGEIKADGEVFWLIPFLDATDRKRLARTCNDIIRETASARQWHSFPQNAFAIAQNGAGDNLIVLPITSNAKELGETIYRWDHETGEVTPVADALDLL